MDTPEVDIAALLKPPDILSARRVLCVQPHPDDNEFGMGGIIAALARQGSEVHYLTVTRGDQGGHEVRVSPEETAAIRHEEAIAAGRLLGASAFHFLDHGDGALGDVVSLSAEIAAIIREVKPDAIFCPDPWLPYEAHYDHVITGRAAANALHMSNRVHFPGGGKTEPWCVSAIGFYFTAKPNTVIDISDVFERKIEAIALHRSQVDPPALALYRSYFQIRGQELARNRGFALGEGLKALSPHHTHCFHDAMGI
jgi:LmbE family N-acetylglucosaminyl deacetylase